MKIRSKIVFNEANDSAEKARTRIRYALNERLEARNSNYKVPSLVFATFVTAVLCLYLIPSKTFKDNTTIFSETNDFAELEDESIGSLFMLASADLSEDLSAILTLEDYSNDVLEIEDDETNVDSELESGYDELLYGV